MQLEFTAGERAFAEEVDAFFRANLEPRLSEQVRRNPSYVSKEDMRRWQKALYEQGWIAPNWPKEHGGTGWTPTQKFIFEEAYQRHYAPRLSPFGIMMVGPVIYTFGSEAQKAEHLPAILKSDRFWCQGYSEPGSGSDLASLRTRAVRTATNMSSTAPRSGPAARTMRTGSSRWSAPTRRPRSSSRASPSC